mmetsp:Transcript_14043/g.46851  ORF Transcript_14043/g.46851 Transcript_14043/m.46851 type:complete len:311 (+) Transcript_14043:1794-2726(+)
MPCGRPSRLPTANSLAATSPASCARAASVGNAGPSVIDEAPSSSLPLPLSPAAAEVAWPSTCRMSCSCSLSQPSGEKGLGGDEPRGCVVDSSPPDLGCSGVAHPVLACAAGALSSRVASSASTAAACLTVPLPRAGESGAGAARGPLGGSPRSMLVTPRELQRISAATSSSATASASLAAAAIAAAATASESPTWWLNRSSSGRSWWLRSLPMRSRLADASRWEFCTSLGRATSPAERASASDSSSWATIREAVADNSASAPSGSSSAVTTGAHTSSMGSRSVWYGECGKLCSSRRAMNSLRPRLPRRCA